MPEHAPSPDTLRHARKVPRHHVLRVVGFVVACAVIFTGSSAYALYHELMGNVTSGYHVADLRPTPTATEEASPEPTAPAEEAPPDPHAGEAYNFLVMGTDWRAGENADGTDIVGARADTTILVHVSADRSRVEAVSIPRDTLVDIPACPLVSDGSELSNPRYWEDQTMFNSAFAIGAHDADLNLGAICTLLTVEQMTGLVIEDYAVVDFAGFKRTIDSIGGVPMCVPYRLYSEEAVIDLQPGYQVLDGTQALGYARFRKGRPGTDGSDWSRISEQQDLLAAIVRQLQSKNLVAHSYELIQFLDAATSSLTLSTGLSNPVQLAGLAMAVAPAGPEGVTFVTMPFEEYSENINRVVPTPDAELMWERLRADIPLNSAAAEQTPDSGAGTTPGTTPRPGAPGEGDSPTPEPAPEPSDPWDIKTGLTEPAC